MFIIIYELPGSWTSRKFRAYDECVKTFEEAERMIKKVTKEYKVRAWIMEVETPPIVDVINANDGKLGIVP